MPPSLGLPLALVPGTGLLFGLMLIAAIVGGYTARAVRLPRVVGYLAAGVGLKALLYAVLDIRPDTLAAVELAGAEAPLTAVKDLGLGLILFSIGSVFEVRHLKSVGRHLWKISVCEVGLTAVLVFVGATGAAFLVGGDIASSTRVSFALLLAIAAIATAPAATLFVLREYDAKGPVTDTILSLTGVNNVVCIILFQICFLLLAASGLLGPVTGTSDHVLVGLVVTILGSIGLGVGLGFVISLIHARMQFAETLLIFVAVLMVLGAGEHWLLKHHAMSYNALLTIICFGAVFANVAVDPDRLESGIRTMGGPILVGFFVLAGYRMHLEDLPALGLIGAVYVVCRLGGKLLGCWLGLRWSRAGGEAQPYLGAALLCQAAVVIGLADFVGSYWQDAWAASSFIVTVLGSVVVFEVCGPILTKLVAVRAGEVKAVTLFRGMGTPRTGGASTLGLTWEALRRTFGLSSRSAATTEDGRLRVRHVMRSNIKCIPATARLDDVLHFVEQSRYDHFPVTDSNDELVGIIHFNELRNMIYDPVMRELVTAVDLASSDTRAVPVDMDLGDALDIFRQCNIGSLPVVDAPESRRLVGVVEQRDLLRALHRPEGRGAP
ncbi:MAG: CBS domain-containing protein [Phycisphaerae bacterium]